MVNFIETTDASNSFSSLVNYNISADDSFSGASTEVGSVSDWDVIGINVVAGETYKLTFRGTSIHQLDGQIQLTDTSLSNSTILNPLADTVTQTGTPLSYLYNMENNPNEIEVRFTATTTGQWLLGIVDESAGASFNYDIEFSITCPINFMNNATNADDNLVGTADADVIDLMAGDDSFIAGDCDDSIRGGTGWDTLKGGDGEDQLEGGDEHDWLYGQAGNDMLLGGRGDDLVSGGNGHDKVYGENGSDRLYGGFGNDTVSGGIGKDTVYGGRGHDYLTGEEGHDYLNGQRGSDYIFGGAHNDTLIGGMGNDTLLGGSEHDLLRGGQGKDWLEGGTGEDTLNGGNNSDVFVLRVNTGTDRVTDYTDGVDKIAVANVNDIIWTQVGAHTHLRIDGVNGEMLLLNVNVNDIDISDFILL